jgi:hypothetical protein
MLSVICTFDERIHALITVYPRLPDYGLSTYPVRLMEEP